MLTHHVHVPAGLHILARVKNSLSNNPPLSNVLEDIDGVLYTPPPRWKEGRDVMFSSVICLSRVVGLHISFFFPY